MPTDQHAAPPPDPAPPQSRRDDTSPAAGHQAPTLTPERRALRDAWLAELWPTCPEYHPGDQPRPYRTAA